MGDTIDSTESYILLHYQNYHLLDKGQLLVIFRRELLQIQMRLLFPFLLTKNIHGFLLLMRNRGFLTLLYVGVTYARLVYTWYKNIFYMIAVLIVYLTANNLKMR